MMAFTTLTQTDRMLLPLATEQNMDHDFTLAFETG